MAKFVHSFMGTADILTCTPGDAVPAEEGRASDMFDLAGNNVANEIDYHASSASILFLGVQESISACRLACMRENDCSSFVYHSCHLDDMRSRPSKFRKLCYGRLDSKWAPIRQKGVYSERIRDGGHDRDKVWNDMAQIHYGNCDNTTDVYLHKFTRSGLGNEITQLVISFHLAMLRRKPLVMVDYEKNLMWLGKGWCLSAINVRAFIYI
jgi:hypothetical protein